MPYRIEYHPDVAKEIKSFKKNYPIEVYQELRKWFDEIAEEAERNLSQLSLEFREFVLWLYRLFNMLRHWPNIWLIFLSSSGVEKILAIWNLLTGGVPYSVIFRSKEIEIFLKSSTVDCSFAIISPEVSKDGIGRLRVMTIDGLPLQGTPE